MTRRLGAIAFVAALLALLLGSGGCQFIVTSDVPAFTCRGAADGICPSGQYCAGAGCVPCETTDPCDGLDNDCNGKVDDGPDSDHDGDGFTWCGVLDADGGGIDDRDCRDDDKDVHPGAKEVCNGKDDDCNGLVDDGSCPDNTTCAPKTGTCVSNATACDPVSRPCPAPQVCDPGTRQCVTKNSAKLGEVCKSDEECEAGSFCGYAPVLTGQVVQTAGGVCTKGCCQSSDCPTSFVCYSFGTGGSYCIAKGVLARDVLGTLRGGDACTNGSQCRSGACTPNGKCEDVCCSDANCTAPAVCRATTVGNHTVFGCADPNGSVTATNYCGGTTRCAHGVCADDNTCYDACCGSSGCGTVYILGTGNVPLECDDVSPLSHAGDFVPACAGAVPTGGAAVGASCTKDDDCRSHRCYTDQVSGKKFCSDVCCTDNDCKAGGLVCRPYDLGQGHFFLRCQKPTG